MNLLQQERNRVCKNVNTGVGGGLDHEKDCIVSFSHRNMKQGQGHYQEGV